MSSASENNRLYTLEADKSSYNQLSPAHPTRLTNSKRISNEPPPNPPSHKPPSHPLKKTRIIYITISLMATRPCTLIVIYIILIYMTYNYYYYPPPCCHVHAASRRTGRGAGSSSSSRSYILE